jgi:hypothetical protein
MVGALATNLHEGSRSEILADYLFSAWGTVTPVRRQDDYGIDLYCTLTERVGQRARVEDYFTAQVKSTEDPWPLQNREAVEWLIHYPTPLFLCVVNKKETRVRVYHVFPRYYLWAMGQVPDSLELTPGSGKEGQMVQWTSASSYSLSAPIIEATLADLNNDDRMASLRTVFRHWVRLDRENGDRVRQGLLRFHMPPSYAVNEIPSSGIGIQQLAHASPDLILRGLHSLGEAVECIGGQLAQKDPELALKAALLLDRLQSQYPDAFKDDPLFRFRVPAFLGQFVTSRLNQAIGGNSYRYAGLEEVERRMAADSLIATYLAERE